METALNSSHSLNQPPQKAQTLYPINKNYKEVFVNEHLLSKEELIQRLQDAEATALERDIEIEKLKKTIAKIGDFDPDTQIALIWSIEDVQQERPHLTDEQAMDVLDEVKRRHDATIGVNWDTLAIHADYLYPQDFSPLICKECGYLQHDRETIKAFQGLVENAGLENHDIDYLCGACQDNRHNEDSSNEGK